MDSIQLITPCKYSFEDLLNAFSRKTGFKIDKNELYKLNQQDRNDIVKELCKYSQWYWSDIIGSDGIIYTAFSPNKK